MRPKAGSGLAATTHPEPSGYVLPDETTAAGATAFLAESVMSLPETTTFDAITKPAALFRTSGLVPWRTELPKPLPDGILTFIHYQTKNLPPPCETKFHADWRARLNPWTAVYKRQLSFYITTLKVRIK